MVQLTIRPGLTIETGLISRLQELFSDELHHRQFRNQQIFLTIYLEPWDKLRSDEDLLARIGIIAKTLRLVSLDFAPQEDRHELCVSIPIFYPTSVEGDRDRFRPVINYLRQHAVTKIQGWEADYPRNGLPFRREIIFRR